MDPMGIPSLRKMSISGMFCTCAAEKTRNVSEGNANLRLAHEKCLRNLVSGRQLLVCTPERAPHVYENGQFIATF